MTGKKQFAKLAFFIAVLVAFAVLGAAGVARPFRTAVFSAMAPAFDAAGRFGSAARVKLIYFSGSRGAYEEERRRLTTRLAEAEAVFEENKTLRIALGLRAFGDRGAVPAEAIAFFRDGRDEYIVLNRGADDGIGTGDIVVNAEQALGGTVISTDRNAARVILFSSPSRSIDVLVASSSIRAIARGANAREFSIELIPNDAAISAGDLVLASPRVTGGRPLPLAEIREARQAEHEAFKTVRAIHLFDPADPTVIVLLRP